MRYDNVAFRPASIRMGYQVHPRSRSVDQRHDNGPFDIIGDVHGCMDELESLFDRLGYAPNADGAWRSRTGRTAIFVGDLVDRGPRIADALRVPMEMVAAGVAFVVPGNHDLQYARHLAGDDIPIVYGLEDTIAQMSGVPAPFLDDVLTFFQTIKGHYVFDGGRLVVAHTGLPAELHGRDTPETRQLAAYGVLDGEIDPTDPSRRHSWVATYSDEAAVVYGHTKVVDAIWDRNTIDIDTGCVFGWRLTALTWPERQLVSVPARREYIHSTSFRRRCAAQ
jgi:protein phosphatase